MTTPWLTDEQQRIWRNWLRLNRELQATLAREIAATSDLSMADFGVLVQLTDVPEGRARISELADNLGWERSRVSHQLKRMQSRGLVERFECAEDGRGSFVGVTDAGRRAIADAAPGHVASVRRLVVDHLSDAEFTDFGRLVDRLLEALDSD
ncbi:MarR family winged helix-turn-helix transcriptional regulator [Nocardioides sp.]|uniref:MarR family winged helix-turn-helix transcriptional regulator n=1 Tax=Nocardioides sp. TaxID=35761 RepID=UPI002CAC43AB|nr:MarR family transcriptional regulator [Nocardioides sp.]HSX66508.1 MarR family transcriptional regulator [Nocardioides sp.]